MAEVSLNSKDFVAGVEAACKALALSGAQDLFRLGNDIANLGKEHLTANGSVDTGRLRNDYGVKAQGITPNGAFCDVGTRIEYAGFVEYGTLPHEIRPNGKQALSWPGAKHPVKVVHHPGSDPKPFHRPAVMEGIARWKPTARP